MNKILVINASSGASDKSAQICRLALALAPQTHKVGTFMKVHDKSRGL